jgi:hypothetical protein
MMSLRTRFTTALRATFTAAALVVGAVFVRAAEPAPREWTPLLDEKLSQWEPFLGVPLRNIEVPGYTYAKGKPIGLRDPTGIFKVRLQDGEPVLFVSGEILGGLTSLKSYANYHLRLQFRWGEKRWSPRLKNPRDNGILYHCVGEHGAFGNVWMRSVELQIQENDIGDFWPLSGTGADFPSLADGNFRRYKPGAKLAPYFARVMRGTDYHEKPNGEWNDIELIVVGGDSWHILNGRVVNELRNIRYKEKKGSETKEIPLTEGRLQIQSEYAEAEFRRIEIKAVAPGKLPFQAAPAPVIPTSVPTTAPAR